MSESGKGAGGIRFGSTRAIVIVRLFPLDPESRRRHREPFPLGRVDGEPAHGEQRWARRSTRTCEDGCERLSGTQ
jgi:hypothetical protein